MSELVTKVLKQRYRIDKFIGRGGMAEVYQVWDVQLGVACTWFNFWNSCRVDIRQY